MGAALLFNMLSGLSCLIAGIIAANVEMSSSSHAALLVWGGGIYIWTAVGESLSGVSESTSSCLNIILRSVVFWVGFGVIALVLLKHEHCDGHGDGHDGHHH